MSRDGSPCMDCGALTTPCTGKHGCRHVGRWEYYGVKEHLWLTAVPEDDSLIMMFLGAPQDHFYLCIGCLEQRIGRRLRSSDFKNASVNAPDHPWDTPRLLSRLNDLPDGATAYLDLAYSIFPYWEIEGPPTEEEWTLFIRTLEDALGDIARSSPARSRNVDITRRRFGVPPYHYVWTYPEIGEEMGVSQERCRQVVSNVIRKLRQPFREVAPVNGVLTLPIRETA